MLDDIREQRDRWRQQAERDRLRVGWIASDRLLYEDYVSA